MGYGKGNEARIDTQRTRFRFKGYDVRIDKSLMLRCQTKDVTSQRAVSVLPKDLAFSSETGFVTVTSKRHLLELGG
jgi:hypothetical protein